MQYVLNILILLNKNASLLTRLSVNHHDAYIQCRDLQPNHWQPAHQNV